VRAELGLPISIGVARTKHLAKIASQVAKPDGLVVVDPDTELEFLHHLPVGLMWGVARSLRRVWPRSACLLSSSWQRTPDGRLSDCSVPQRGKNSQR
jgi:DNA polymerase-4